MLLSTLCVTSQMMDSLVIYIMKNGAYPDLDHKYMNYTSIGPTYFGVKKFQTTKMRTLNQKY
jgi:hypothetical protein